MYLKIKLTILSVVAAVAFTACGSSFDPTAVKEGMTEAEVKAAVGDPSIEMTIMGKTNWTYGEHVVTFEEGVVTSCEKVTAN